MTPNESNNAIDSVRKHLHAMLDKLEKMKEEQEEDLRNITGEAREKTEVSLTQTKKLIEEIKKSQVNIEAALKPAGNLTPDL